MFKNAKQVARSLLGQYLMRKRGRKTEAYKIVEVELYDGPEDKANHAHKGRTKRTEVMFGPAGYWYVYLCYGMHEMLNLVVGPKDYPAAVLIRAIEKVTEPYASVLQNTSIRKAGNRTDRNYSLIRTNKRIDGPGRLTKALGINRKLNGKKADKKSGLWIEDRKEKISSYKIKKTPRIGVAYAEEWAEKPLRFVLKSK